MTTTPTGPAPTSAPLSISSDSLAQSYGPATLPSSALVGLTHLGPPGESSNYDDWELAMSASIYGAGLRHLIEPELRDRSQPDSHWKQQNDGLFSVLLRYVHPDNYDVMRSHLGNAAMMWTALSNFHNDSSVASKLLVLRRLIGCQLIGEDIEGHVTQVERLGSRLGQLCVKSPLTLDDIICAALSASLPNDSNAAISGLLTQRSMSSTAMATALCREGVRRKDHESANNFNTVLLTQQTATKRRTPLRPNPTIRPKTT